MADFNFVLPRLATGAAINSSADVDALVAAGITVVVDCRAEFDDAPLLSAKLMYLWDGTEDDGQPKPVQWFSKTTGFLAGAYSNPQTRIYFHCAAGINRGPSMCYFFMRSLGFSSTDAEALIRKARPQVGLRYKEDADTAIKVLGYENGYSQL
jgi:protein-tyrosine phosphatase